MLKTITLTMSIAVASAAAQNIGQRIVTMQELTVPADRLPAGCVLSPADSVRLDGNKVRGGNWAGLRIPTNPWVGTDPPLIASIRARMDGPVLMPDGPPLSAREAARYRLRLAEGVEEAYAAIYIRSESELIVVYGSRFASSAKTVHSRNDARAATNPRVIRVAMGPIVAMVTGGGGPCFQAVGAHLKSLAN